MVRIAGLETRSKYIMFAQRLALGLAGTDCIYGQETGPRPRAQEEGMGEGRERAEHAGKQSARVRREVEKWREPRGLFVKHISYNLNAGIETNVNVMRSQAL